MRRDGGVRGGDRATWERGAGWPVGRAVGGGVRRGWLARGAGLLACAVGEVGLVRGAERRPVRGAGWLTNGGDGGDGGGGDW